MDAPLSCPDVPTLPASLLTLSAGPKYKHWQRWGLFFTDTDLYSSNRDRSQQDITILLEFTIWCLCVCLQLMMRFRWWVSSLQHTCHLDAERYKWSLSVTEKRNGWDQMQCKWNQISRCPHTADKNNLQDSKIKQSSSNYHQLKNNNNNNIN